MIQDGFVLTEKEALENMVTKRIVNRRSKKVLLQPKQLTEEEFIARCREESSNMLMEVGDSVNKHRSKIRFVNTESRCVLGQVSPAKTLGIGTYDSNTICYRCLPLKNPKHLCGS